MSPPPGGWGILFVFKGHAFEVGPLPRDCVSGIKKILQANGAPEPEAKIWEFCNSVWCRRAPERSLLKDPAEAPSERVLTPGSNGDHRVMDPNQYGPKIWGWLHTFGMKGAFDKRDWQRAIVRVSRMLDPDNNPDTGCGACFSEWVAITKDRPPQVVDSAYTAARWVHYAHNRVNRKLGKAQWDWRKAVIEHGWDVELS